MSFIKRTAICKKSLFFAFYLFVFSSFAFSQQLRAGLYGSSQFPLGEVSDYYSNVVAEGVSAELSLMDNFGLLARFQFAVALPKDERILYTKQFTQSLCLWYSLKFGESGFSFEPSVEAGCMVQESNVIQQAGSLPNKLYFDLAVQVNPSIRFSHPKFLDNRVELDLSPVVTVVPQKESVLTYIGARIGLLYLYK